MSGRAEEKAKALDKEMDEGLCPGPLEDLETELGGHLGQRRTKIECRKCRILLIASALDSHLREELEGLARLVCPYCGSQFATVFLVTPHKKDGRWWHHLVRDPDSTGYSGACQAGPIHDRVAAIGEG